MKWSLLLLSLALSPLFFSCSSGGANAASTEENKLLPDSSRFLQWETDIRAIHEDSDGNIWFGSHMEGAARFDGQTMHYYTQDNGLSHNQVRSIHEDANGHVWFECGYGLSRYANGRMEVVEGRDYSQREAWSLSQNDLWFKSDATIGNSADEGVPGAYRYDGEALHFHAFPFTGERHYMGWLAVSTPFQRGLDGSVWVGCYNAIFHYDGDTIIAYDDAKLNLNEQTGYMHCRSLFVDSKGRTWFGNNGNGVWRIEGDSAIHFSRDMGLIIPDGTHDGGDRSPDNSLEHVFAIGEDADGNMWFGDRDSGVWRYDGSKMKRFSEMDGLLGTMTWDIHVSKSGKLWIGMEGGAVREFDGSGFVRIF